MQHQSGTLNVAHSVNNCWCYGKHDHCPHVYQQSPHTVLTFGLPIFPTWGTQLIEGVCVLAFLGEDAAATEADEWLAAAAALWCDAWLDDRRKPRPSVSMPRRKRRPSRWRASTDGSAAAAPPTGDGDGEPLGESESEPPVPPRGDICSISWLSRSRCACEGRARWYW